VTGTAGLGITTVRQLAAAEVAPMAARFGPTTGPRLILTARGIGADEVSSEPYVPRSRSREVTYQEDLTVQVRYKPFFTRTRGVPLAEPTSDRAAIELGAALALGKFTDRRPVRLLAVRAEFE
jgi:DNA polymerase IV